MYGEEKKTLVASLLEQADSLRASDLATA